MIEDARGAGRRNTSLSVRSPTEGAESLLPLLMFAGAFFDLE